MPTKVDYNLLEREYITGDTSIRALAAKHNVSWSTVNAQKNKRDWDRKRDEFRSKRDEKTVERLAERASNDADILRDELLLVLRAAVRRFGADLANGQAQVSARDLAALIPQINLLLGEPTTRSEAQILGINLGGALEPDILRRVVEVARKRGPDERGVEPASALVPSQSRPN